MRKALNARENQLPSTNCILEAVEICLKSNHSVFKENFFLQIHGTAMGPKNACSYVDLAMGEIDFQAKFSGPIKPASWRRYRDGCSEYLISFCVYAFFRSHVSFFFPVT